MSQVVTRQVIQGTATLLVLTAMERRALNVARQVAEEARAHVRAALGEVEADHLDFDTMLADVVHGCRDLAESSMVLLAMEGPDGG